MFRTVAPREAVEALILVAHHAQVAGGACQLHQQLLLDVVRVLVLVHQQERDGGDDGGGRVRLLQQVVRQPLQMGEVHAVPLAQPLLVALAGSADGGEEVVVRSGQQRRINQLLGDLVEVAPCALDCRPAGCPTAQVLALPRFADDVVEVLEDEQQLGQVVQRLVAVAEGVRWRWSVSSRLQGPVDGGDGQLREIALVAHLAGGGRQPVAHFEGRLLREGAKHDFLRLRLPKQQQIQRPQDDAVRLAGTGSGDHQQRAIRVPHHGPLAVRKFGVVLADAGGNLHSNPACLKLNVSSDDTTR